MYVGRTLEQLFIRHATVYISCDSMDVCGNVCVCKQNNVTCTCLLKHVEIASNSRYVKSFQSVQARGFERAHNVKATKEWNINSNLC